MFDHAVYCAEHAAGSKQNYNKVFKKICFFKESINSTAFAVNKIVHARLQIFKLCILPVYPSQRTHIFLNFHRCEKLPGNKSKTANNLASQSVIHSTSFSGRYSPSSLPPNCVMVNLKKFECPVRRAGANPPFLIHDNPYLTYCGGLAPALHTEGKDAFV